MDKRFTPFADEEIAEREALRRSRSERMRKLNADPMFAKAHAERSAERMRALRSDHCFVEANIAAVKKAQKNRWEKWRKSREN